jgi:hypothetical protein
VLLHARERHVELLGKVRDRSVASSELLQNATPRGVRERGERSIELGRYILNHLVQYITQAFAACKVAAKDDASYDLSAPFLSAFPLFALEPMVAKSILPALGGTPMVGNTRLRGIELRIEFVRWLCPEYLVPYSQTTSVRFVAKTTGLSGLQRELAFKPFSKMRGLRAAHRAIADSK